MYFKGIGSGGVKPMTTVSRLGDSCHTGCPLPAVHLKMGTSFINPDLTGLSSQEVLASRAAHGENKLERANTNKWLATAKAVIQEPMLLLLAVASALYFIHGDTPEAVFLLAAIVLIYSISKFQQVRSENALEALKKLTQPKCTVIRDHRMQEILREELVVGDLLVVEEGAYIAADAVLIQAHDFTVNESVLTGESMPVEKNTVSNQDPIFQGTMVLSGLAIGQVTAVGASTQVGTIGRRLEEIPTQPSPLQTQINSFVRKMAGVGIVIFVIIWGVNIYNTRLVVDSLLNALTLAMSILPEEIPVAFATFMALGAWRLMQAGVIVKDVRTVETLGSATVIAVDKTGTLTKNEMTLDKVYVYASDTIYSVHEQGVEDVVTTAMWASEPIPFDPMEKSLHATYGKICGHDRRPDYKLVREYPLSGTPPFMTHVFENAQGDQIIAAKGAPEAILNQSTLASGAHENVMRVVHTLASQGYRVLGVGRAENSTAFPQKQSQFIFTFRGLVAFLDPPKDNMGDVMAQFYQAGIQVKIITGDNAQTTRNIAGQIGFQGLSRFMTGDELVKLSERELDKVVSQVNIFARMFPEAKLRVIESLKRRGQVVAMTGDGVNDGPALKAAHIGIAMGKKGTEIAKQASTLVLADDDLASMVTAISTGRKIYTNLKKAIQYIISIHIPIILIVFLPLVFGWTYPAIFSPVHVIFLELIMGPTCSVIYENEPIEPNAMRQRPRILSTTFFKLHELSTSILQGIVITAGLAGIYRYAVASGGDLRTTTALVFITLIAGNITLTLVNRSFYYSIFSTLRYRNYLVPLMITATIGLTGLIFVIPPVRNFFNFAVPSLQGLVISVATGFLSVIWFEGYKWIIRLRRPG